MNGQERGRTGEPDRDGDRERMHGGGGETKDRRFLLFPLHQQLSSPPCSTCSFISSHAEIKRERNREERRGEERRGEEDNDHQHLSK